MQLAAFAFDYDGTLAHDGCVSAATVAALGRLKAAGPRLLLISGRELPDLQRVFPHYALFDAIIAENGGLLFQPGLHEERVLGSAPPEALVQALRRRHVQPLSIGRSILATSRPHDAEVLAAIRECGVEWQIIFNKGAVMCLPPGVNKASGLSAALATLQLSALNVLGVGDAENDHAMLQACGYRAAVANAIDTLKREADIVTQASDGAGVVELVERFLSDPPQAVTAAVRRHDTAIGRDADGREAVLPPDATVLIAGSSGGGKSRLAKLLIERFTAHGFQLCIVDPEGDYEGVPGVMALGDEKTAPGLPQAEGLLREPRNHLALNLLGVDLTLRPRYLASIAAMVESLRVQWARPHWLLIDEAHHTIPAATQAALLAAPRQLPGTVLISSRPDALARHALDTVQILISLGEEARQAIESFCRVLQVPTPTLPGRAPQRAEALYWDRRGAAVPAGGEAPRLVQLDEPAQRHQRHLRKYARGSLGIDKSFHFRGPAGALNLRAQNLSVFLQLAEGVDDPTWLFHLQRGDYSRWFRDAIDDEELADAAARVEREHDQDARTSRQAMRDLVNRRYTAPA
ncbi:MAG TPA: HAD-IIB family hydrolase [Steroidobacteraceae bacterium]|jgi:hypothetical protein